MKTINKQTEQWLKEHIYQAPWKTEFLFWKDIEVFLGKGRYKAFTKFMMCSTVMALPCNDSGVYPVDFIRFMKGYKINPD